MGCLSSKEEESRGGGNDNNNKPSAKPGQQSEEEVHKMALARRRLTINPGEHVNYMEEAKRQAAAVQGADIDNMYNVDGVSSAASVSPRNSIGAGEEDKKYIVAMQSKKGRVPYSNKKVNQDRCMVQHNLCGMEQVSVFGVMDGHGEFGHDVSEFVKNNLPKYLEKEASLLKDTKSAILNAVKALVGEMKRTMYQITPYSGTTCVFAVRIEDSFWVANIGDSRCVVCKKKDGDNSLTALRLTRDQKPDDEDEKQRILKAGGRVCPLPGPPNEDMGPARVWLANEWVPGLAMSRSIGDDVSQRVGVISTPEVSEYKVTGDDLFIVWASDGVWEFVSDETACKTVFNQLRKSTGDAKSRLVDATKALVQISEDEWKENEKVIDDISCVIVQLKEVQ